MNWISVKDELPKKGSWIVYTQGLWFDVAIFRGSDEDAWVPSWITANSSILWEEVTHWAYLFLPDYAVNADIFSGESNILDVLHKRINTETS